LIVVEPVTAVALVPVLVVPEPQAARIASNRGIPNVKAKIRDQLLFMIVVSLLQQYENTNI
jgi:hypothetical protein